MGGTNAPVSNIGGDTSPPSPPVPTPLYRGISDLRLGFGLSGCVTIFCLLWLGLPSLVEGGVVLQQGVEQNNAFVLKETIEVGVAVGGAFGTW